MRARWLVLSVVATAACDDSIYVEVRTADLGVDNVELFVGVDQCTQGDVPCDGVAPPGYTFHYPGDVFFHDPQDSQTPLRAAPGSDGSAWFKFAASSASVHMIAIGRAADGARGASVIENVDLIKGPLHIVSTLAPTVALGDTTHDRTGLAFWTTAKGDTCMGAENTNDARAGRGAAVFIVPDADTDCDDVPVDAECDPLAYLTDRGNVDPTMPTCVQHFPITPEATNITVCEIGGLGCSERSPGTSMCSPTDICVPDAMCAACGVFSPACIPQGFDDATTRVACTISATRAAAGDPYTACDDGSGPLAKFGDDSAFGRNATGAPGLARLFELQGGFQPSVTIDTGNGHALTLTPIDFQTKCKFDLKLDGEIDPLRVTQTEPLGNTVMEFMMEGTSKTPPQEVLLPLTLQFVDDGCTSKSTCAIESGTLDSVLDCLKAP
jgi:hypothetical protein